MEEGSDSLQDLLAGLDSCESVLEDRETFPVANQSYKLQIAQLDARPTGVCQRSNRSIHGLGHAGAHLPEPPYSPGRQQWQ